MNLLEVLGCIGGVLFLINYMIIVAKHIINMVRKWDEYKAAWDEKYNDASNKNQIGFKQEEKKEKENPLKDIEKIKLKETDEISSWFEEYWESEPVDNEFIEEEMEEEYEDELDKYPLLKVRRE